MSRTFTPNDLFVFAAMGGSLDLVKERYTAEVDIDYNEPGKGSALLQAAHRRHGDIVEWLLSQGADPGNFFDGWMQRPMDAALDGNRAIPTALSIWRAGGHATGYPFRTPKFGRGNRVSCRLDSEIADTFYDETYPIDRCYDYLECSFEIYPSQVWIGAFPFDEHDQIWIGSFCPTPVGSITCPLEIERIVHQDDRAIQYVGVSSASVVTLKFSDASEEYFGDSRILRQLRIDART